MVTGKREIQAIAVLLSVGVYLGISDKTTKFVFPAFGQDIFELIRFYLLATIALITIVIWLAQNHNIPSLPKIPPLYTVILNFSIFFMLTYTLFAWIVSGNLSKIPIPNSQNFIEQSIIASFENTIAVILVPTIFPWGTGTGSVLRSPISLFKLRDYELKFDPPSINRFKYGLIGVLFITLLHAGAYSFQQATINQFYIAMVIAGIMFAIFWWVKETFGFGSCIATHLSWNLILISSRGAIF